VAAYRTVVYNSAIIALIQTGEGARWSHDKAKLIENTARRPGFSPVRSGRLRASHVTLPGVGTNQYQKRWAVSALAYYAAYVHQGTGIYGPRHRPIIGWQRVPWNIGGRNKPGKTSVVYMTKGQLPNPWLLRAAESVIH
jgi:hypothetical protein